MREQTPRRHGHEGAVERQDDEPTTRQGRQQADGDTRELHETDEPNDDQDDEPAR